MELAARIEALRDFPFFTGLPEDQLEALIAKSELIQKPKHHYLYVPGDTSNQIYFLLEGTIKVGVYSPDYKEIIRHLLHPKAYFGELSLTGEEAREDFAMSMNEPVTVLAIHTADLLQAMQHNHHLHVLIMQALGRRLKRAEHRAEALITKDARSRIIDFIRETIDKRGQQIGYEYLLRHSLTQQDIASITGTSRQTVTLVLNELRKSNLIFFTRNSILVRDIGKLAEIAA